MKKIFITLSIIFALTAKAQIVITPATSVTATSPLSVTSGTAISIPQANTTTNGYVSSTDWNTFNNKQNTLVAGTNITITSNTISATGGGGGGGPYALMSSFTSGTIAQSSTLCTDLTTTTATIKFASGNCGFRNFNITNGSNIVAANWTMQTSTLASTLTATLSIVDETTFTTSQLLTFSGPFTGAQTISFSSGTLAIPINTTHMYSIQLQTPAWGSLTSTTGYFYIMIQ